MGMDGLDGRIYIMILLLTNRILTIFRNGKLNLT